MRPHVLACIALLASPLAAAQDPAARVTCDVDASRLVVEYLPDATESPDPDEAGLVHFGELLVLDEEETSVVDSRTQVRKCVLLAQEYAVELAPLVSNVNLLGRCGGAYAGTVGVKRDGVVVLEELELEALNCHERERWVARVVIRPDAEPVVEYRSYEQP